MHIVASLYYDFFCNNRICGNISNKLEEITPIIGLTEKEKNVMVFLNRGWYDVQDLEMDCFFALFSKQKREKNDKDAKEYACKRNHCHISISSHLIYFCSFKAFFVNVLIYGLGCYENSNFMYPRMFEIMKMYGTFCPGSTGSRGNYVNSLFVFKAYNLLLFF